MRMLPFPETQGSNPVVHSLLVTLSNHTILGNQLYNDHVRMATSRAAKQSSRDMAQRVAQFLSLPLRNQI
jgi:hypothetical protein